MYTKMHLCKIYNVTYIVMTLLLRIEKKMVIYLGLVLLTSGLRFKPRQPMKCRRVFV